MECKLSYSLINEHGKKIDGGEDAQAKIDEQSLSILPQLGQALFYSLRDITSISGGDYKINIHLSSREQVILYHIGYKYDDFSKALFRSRNELILRDMLMHEKLNQSGVEADFDYTEGQQLKFEQEKCELRLYETGLVIIPENSEIMRIPYSDISKIRETDYSLIIETDFDEVIVFSKMGRRFAPFTKALSDLLNQLSLKTQSMLKELLPTADPTVIRRAAGYMKEGRAAKRSDIEAISAPLWIELEKKLEIAKIKEEYDFLNSMAYKEKICIGFKRGLMGDLTGEYIWFLMPIFSNDPAQPGNAIAMEAASTEGRGGNATYFFRIVSRSEYKDYNNLDQEVDDFIKRLNRAMIAINFRREPVYLPDERLNEPRYLKYRFAVDKLPELRKLRKLFIGRVFHRQHEQWAKDIMELLRFNVSTLDDELKWKDDQTEPGEN